MRKYTDFLVIGSGLAGLSFALKVASKGKVTLISKTTIKETNTSYAQGGIAAVTYSPDSYDKHIQDTLKAGAGLCNEEIVRMVVSKAPRQIEDLVRWGTDFDKKTNGQYDLGREGGHSEYRILHHKDNTGYEIQRALSQRAINHPNIEILENHFAVDIITQHHLGELVKRSRTDIQCYGAYVLNIKTNKIYTFLARTTFMATGGVGNIYQTTTNPIIATGDGIAMVYRAKGIIENVEFIQFHPTSLYNPVERPSFLITEALRGFGAILKNKAGEKFMHEYDERGSLAPRDIVARAIDKEMKTRGDDYVYIDATHLNSKELIQQFPTIYKKCKQQSIDITKDYIPVVPAAHYICGGIKVNENGCSTIHNLYASGENTSTGLHGANRLASNSLLEAVVFSDNASTHAIEHFKSVDYNESVPDWDESGTTHPEELILITQAYKELQMFMSNYVGIVRSNLRLKRVLDRLEIIYRETEDLFDKSILSPKICELRNAINVAYIIVKMASKRKESIGLHYNVDYPPKKA